MSFVKLICFIASLFQGPHSSPFKKGLSHQFDPKTLIKPSPLPESLKNQLRCDLTPWGLACLSIHYIQWGLLFSKLDDQAIDRLKTSLSAALNRFYPLADRLRTEQTDGGMFVCLEHSNGGDGVEFVHAVANNVTVADVAADEVPLYTRKFFALNGVIAYDAHLLHVLAVHVTQLADGMFLGCSFNHAVGDGISCMNFLKAWAEICWKDCVDEGSWCVDDQWLIEDVKLPVKLPFSHPDEFIDRFSPPAEFRERIFHLSSQSVAQLKSKANDECSANGKISMFQALCSLIWRAVSRARCLQPEQKTGCRLAADNRQRLRPRLADNFFGCAAVFIYVNITVGELLGQGLGKAAMLVHQSVVAHDDGTIRGNLRAWVETPIVYQPSRYDPYGITVGSSPRFDLYGCDFGWGKAVAVRSGVGSKYDGKIAMYMGREGKGSVDLEVNLESGAMAALELDEELMSVVSL